MTKFEQPVWVIENTTAGSTAENQMLRAVAEAGGRFWMRNGIKPSEGKHIRWLVGKLNGVYVYIELNSDNSWIVALSTKDIYP